ncbi:hypothetical protein Pcinc_028132 [Petrolisthes cinctipes]|uniref:DDE-1 domain-containing protein n=1 Tax=Petrolisthes cinctipes TaxID=88211 RepID=A0AAE1K5S1_PETCI|nr:hypothetical protein Pcinc_028132 [Petrolisthes cinctipes]
MEEGEYTPDQVFNCDETGVYWKKSPKATYAHKNLRQAAGTKMAKDRFSVLLCCNASGDFKMKPVIIYKYAKPHSYRHCDMNNLPNCVWYSNNSGYMTATLSLKWLDNTLVPQTRQINEATIALACEAARQELDVVARETADVIRAVPGLSCVLEEEIVDLVGGEDREEIAEEMLNQDEEKEEEKQEDKEEKLKPNEPTVKDLSEILAVLSQVHDKVTALQFNSRDQALVYF